jgi:hypothetical protein
MSKLGEALAKDPVPIKWVRTALATFTAAGAALIMAYQGAQWFLGQAETWAESLVEETTEDWRQQTESTSDAVSNLHGLVGDLSLTVESLSDSVNRIAETQTAQSAPAWRWEPPAVQISDGEIGGFVAVQAAGYKLRECGAPALDLYFINGGNLFHRFADVSIINDNGRAITLPTDPDRVQVVNFTARIPGDDGVQPGRAQAYMTVTYPDLCPNVRAETFGPIQFRITPNT